MSASLDPAKEETAAPRRIPTATPALLLKILFIGGAFYLCVFIGGSRRDRTFDPQIKSLFLMFISHHVT